MKHIAKICFFCRGEFEDWQDKHAHRADIKKGYNFNNTVILCTQCKEIFIKNKIELYNLVFKKGHIAEYFKPFGRKRQHNYIRKIRELRRKND